MTHKEKINILKDTIIKLYEQEGRSKSYISSLLNVDRRVLTYQIKEWNLKQKKIHRLTPSNQKFANKHRQLIKSRLDNNISQVEIAKELGVSRDYLRNIIHGDEGLNKINQEYLIRIKNQAIENKENKIENSSLEYNFVEIEGEIWKEILGYENYFISNFGRVKKYIKTYDSFILLKTTINPLSKREYVNINKTGLQVSRLVGFAFVEGHNQEKNTIDHINGNPLDNRAENLEWVSQSENNKRAYINGKKPHKSYSKNGKFKQVVVNNKYTFKTIVATAKFLGVSPTQVQRYIDDETKNDYNIKLIY